MEDQLNVLIRFRAIDSKLKALRQAIPADRLPLYNQYLQNEKQKIVEQYSLIDSESLKLLDELYQ